MPSEPPQPSCRALGGVADKSSPSADYGLMHRLIAFCRPGYAYTQGFPI